MSHPLTGNENWKFWQPYLQAKATVRLMSSMKVANDQGENISLLASSTCREGVVSNMRQGLWEKTMDGKKDGYKTSFKRLKRIRLFDPELHKELKGENQIRVAVNGLKAKGHHNGELEQSTIDAYILVADALVGLPSVLLSHRRPEGDWWRTDPNLCKVQGGDGNEYISWNGTDNWFMRHPSLLAIITGLSRQAALLTAHGFADQVLDCVKREHVEEALTTSDWKLAYGLCEELRPFIEVPNGSEGNYSHYPFPYGQWNRFDRLHRAQRRHNYEKIFDSNFYDGWGITKDASGGQLTGSFSYWGAPGSDGVETYERLMKLGEPRRRAKGVQKAKGKA